MMREHLEPKTYWEKRCVIAEAAVQQLAKILAAYTLPPAGQDDLNQWGRDWDQIVGDLNNEFAQPNDKVSGGGTPSA